MKKAPRIKKALGGDVYGNPIQDDPKKKADADAKKLAMETKIAIPKPSAPSIDEQLYEKGIIGKSELQMRQSTARQIGGTGNTSTGKQKYGLEDPRLEYNRIPKAKGGEVKKMTKCPKFKKGGKC